MRFGSEAARAGAPGQGQHAVRRWRGGLALLAVLALSACGGGSGSSSVEVQNVNGLASVGGAALVGAQVALRCAAGTPETGRVTAEDGTFRVRLNGASTPCLVEVSGGTLGLASAAAVKTATAFSGSLHGYAPVAGVAQVNPLTELLLARALSATPASVFQATGTPVPVLSTAQISAATQYLGEQLTAQGLAAPAAPVLDGAYVLGQGNDRVASALNEVLATVQLNLTELARAAAQQQAWAPVLSEPECEAGTLAWQRDSYQCSAPVGHSASGLTVRLANTLAPNSGGASFTCRNGQWSEPADAGCDPPPSPCTAQAINWVVDGQNCSANLPLTESGGRAAITDSTGPATGSASYHCTNGQWSAPETASCSLPPACPAQAGQWTVGGNSCSGSLLATASGASALATDTTAPATGTAEFACSNGQWGPAQNARCDLPAACASTTATWTVGGQSCSASLAGVASGQSTVATDAVGPATGSATYACSNGVWASPTAASCAVPAACGATGVSWQVGGNSCNASLGATASGASSTAVDSTAPTTGSATYACSNGAWGAPSAASCNLPATCGALAVDWTVDGQRCEATLGSTASGSSVLAQDATLPTLGAATFRCESGTWSAASGASCSAPAAAACSAQMLNWQVGGTACSAQAPGAASGSSVVVTDTDGPATGAASFSCSAGQWGTPTSASCALPAACNSQTQSWTVNGNVCSATTPGTASGQSVLATDATGPATGSATYSCSNGAWGAASNASCNLPAACSARTMNWTAGGNSCSANVATTASGSSVTAVDSVDPATGSAQFSCSDGVWSDPASATCTVPAACNGATLSWTANGNTCSAAVATTASGGSTVATDTTAPATGAATFACSNGAWGSPSNASCTVPAACGAQSQSWTVNGQTCDGGLPATASGAGATATDATGPTTGAASYACSNGSWLGPNNASCSAPANCPGQSLSWSVNGNTCTATVADTASGQSVSLSDSSLPTIGSAAYSCSNGSWGSPTASSCSAPPQGPQTMSLNLLAADGGRWYEYYSYVFGEIGRSWNGSSVNDGFWRIDGLPGYTPIGGGYDVFPNGGQWDNVASLGYNLSGYTGIGPFTTAVTSLSAHFAPYVAERASVLGVPYTTTLSNVTGTVSLQDGRVQAIVATATVTFSYTLSNGNALTFTGSFAINGDQFTLQAGTPMAAGSVAARWDFSGSVRNLATTAATGNRARAAGTTRAAGGTR